MKKGKTERFVITGHFPVRFKGTITPEVFRGWQKQGEPPGLSEILERSREVEETRERCRVNV